MGEQKLIIDQLKAQDMDAVFQQYLGKQLSFFFYKNLLPALFSREQLVFALASPRSVIKSIRDGKQTLAVLQIDTLGNKAVFNLLINDNKATDELKEKIGDVLLDYLKEKPEVEKISTMLLTEETAANETLKKLKFKQEGKFKQHIYLEGKYRDLICWAIFRGEYL